MQDVEDTIGEVTEKGKKTVKQKKNNLEEAVRAGAETYKEEKAKAKQ